VSRDDALRGITNAHGRSAYTRKPKVDAPSSGKPEEPKTATGISDPLVARAAELHRQALDQERLAAALRSQRDDLIRKAKELDPKKWTYTTLANALDCSRELIAVIIRNR